MTEATKLVTVDDKKLNSLLGILQVITSRISGLQVITKEVLAITASFLAITASELVCERLCKYFYKHEQVRNWPGSCLSSCQ